MKSLPMDGEIGPCSKHTLWRCFFGFSKCSSNTFTVLHHEVRIWFGNTFADSFRSYLNQTLGKRFQKRCCFYQKWIENFFDNQFILCWIICTITLNFFRSKRNLYLRITSCRLQSTRGMSKLKIYIKSSTWQTPMTKNQFNDYHSIFKMAHFHCQNFPKLLR